MIIEDDRPLDRHASGDLKSSFKIFFTQTFPLCGATCYMLPSRTMSQLFNDVNFVGDAVDFLTKSLGMAYSVITAQ